MIVLLVLISSFLCAGFWIEFLNRRWRKGESGSKWAPVIGLFGFGFLAFQVWLLLPDRRLLLLLFAPIPVILAPKVRTDWVRVPAIALTIFLEGLAFTATMIDAGDPFGRDEVWRWAVSPDERYEAVVVQDFDGRWLELRPRWLDLRNCLDWPTVKVPQPEYVNLKWIQWEGADRLAIGFHPADEKETIQTRWNGILFTFRPALTPPAEPH